MAICWFGIQTYFGATAIDMGVKYLTGFSNWWLWYALFGVAQVVLTAMGIKWIKYLENLAAPLLTLLSIWLIYAYISQRSWGYFVGFPVTAPMAFWAAVTANLSQAGEQSFVRRNIHSLIGQIPGLTIGMALFVTVGIAGQVITGTGDPVKAIGSTIGGWFMIVGLIVVLLAQLSTNVAANLFAPGYVLASITHGKLTFAAGVVLAGGLGLVFTMPWRLIDAFLVYLPSVGAMLSPVAGIMLADYYLVRGRRLNTAALYESHGQYRYWKGVNPAGIIAHVIASIFGVIYLRFSWLVSVPVAILLYTVLMKAWILRVYRQEEAKSWE